MTLKMGRFLRNSMMKKRTILLKAMALR